MRLRTKIKLFSVLFMLVFIVFINAAVYFLFYKVSTNAEVDRIESQTQVIMEALASTDANVNVNKLLKSYVSAHGMIRVIDEQGVVIEHRSKHAEISSLPADYVNAEKQEVIRRENGARFAVLSIPLIWENGEIVTLQVAEHLVTLQETMSTLFLVLLFASLIMVIPALFGGQLLGTFLLKPIQTLIHTMKENQSEGEWKKIEVNNRSRDELYQMGATYNHMIDRLKESFDKQEQFVSDASHELKTPISVINSYTQLLERWGKQKPEVFDEAIQAIHSETERMNHMTKQMLSLAKNHHLENLSFQSVDIVKLCRETLRVFTVTYQRKIILFTELEELFVSCDKEKVSQVINILIDNALKYSEVEVHVLVDRHDSEITLAVQDFGEGLSAANVTNIFDRFYRVDKARSRETGGTGLGLSIAQSIVRGQGGRITVNSQEGEGSIFTIHLPS